MGFLYGGGGEGDEFCRFKEKSRGASSSIEKLDELVEWSCGGKRVDDDEDDGEGEEVEDEEGWGGVGSSHV